MKCRITTCLAGVSLMLCMTGLAVAKAPKECREDTLRGRYVFTATGYSSVGGGPWFPKAIIEVIEFNGDGTLSVPAATVANPAGNGAVVQAPPGGVGVYSLNADCTGTLQFTPGPSFNLFVAPRDDEFWMIQTNPNNVFQGSVKRVR